MIKPIVFALFFCSYAFALHGVDVSSALSTTVVNCLKGQAFNHIISRCYTSTGAPDQAAKTTHASAAAAGLEFDCYHFPDVAQPPDAQVTAAINWLHTNNIKYGRYWLDIENYRWPTNKTHNVDFVKGMVNKLVQMGVTNIGFYTSKSAWDTIMGTASDFAKYPLWYPQYEKAALVKGPLLCCFVVFNGEPGLKSFISEAARDGGVRFHRRVNDMLMDSAKEMDWFIEFLSNHEISLPELPMDGFQVAVALATLNLPPPESMLQSQRAKKDHIANWPVRFNVKHTVPSLPGAAGAGVDGDGLESKQTHAQAAGAAADREEKKAKAKKNNKKKGKKRQAATATATATAAAVPAGEIDIDSADSDHGAGADVDATRGSRSV